VTGWLWDDGEDFAPGKNERQEKPDRAKKTENLWITPTKKEEGS